MPWTLKPPTHGKTFSDTWDGPFNPLDPNDHCVCGCKSCTCNLAGAEHLQKLFDPFLIQCLSPGSPVDVYDSATVSLSPDPDFRYFLSASGEQPIAGCLAFAELDVNGDPAIFAGTARYSCITCPSAEGKNIEDTECELPCADVTDLLRDGANVFECVSGIEEDTGIVIQGHTEVHLWRIPARNTDGEVPLECNCCRPCCKPNGGCEVLKPDICAGQGGVSYRKSSCEAVGSCGHPCCIDGFCTMRTEQECAANGGTWHGEAANCCEVECGTCGCGSGTPKLELSGFTPVLCCPGCIADPAHGEGRRYTLLMGTGETPPPPVGCSRGPWKIFGLKVENWDAHAEDPLHCIGDAFSNDVDYEITITVVGGVFYWHLNGADSMSGHYGVDCKFCECYTTPDNLPCILPVDVPQDPIPCDNADCATAEAILQMTEVLIQ